MHTNAKQNNKKGIRNNTFTCIRNKILAEHSLCQLVKHVHTLRPGKCITGDGGWEFIPFPGNRGDYLWGKRVEVYITKSGVITCQVNVLRFKLLKPLVSVSHVRVWLCSRAACTSRVLLVWSLEHRSSLLKQAFPLLLQGFLFLLQIRSLFLLTYQEAQQGRWVYQNFKQHQRRHTSTNHNR